MPSTASAHASGGTGSAALVRLSERAPRPSAEDIAARMVPPPQFAQATFASYRPDPAHPSQQQALDRLQAFAGAWRAAQRPGGFFSWNRRPRIERLGAYLDGGFGVGKTHLLAALWHVAHGPKYYGTFIEYTAVIGALGYRVALDLLRPAKLVCIDEFELDDPGDTMLMTRFLGELMAGGTRVAATSNTPPNALGEGRFAAEAFAREIHALADQFETIRIDGEDYRRRDVAGHAQVAGDDAFVSRMATTLAGRGHAVSLDAFPELIAHLAAVHPSAFAELVRGIDTAALTGVTVLHDQNAALRLVAFIDRMYDAEIPILASGIPLDTVFDADMLAGGFCKKYLRCQSRMIALTAGELPPHE